MRAINDAIECNAEARSFVGRIETLVQEADARLRARLIADEFNRIGFPAEAVGESVSVQTSGPGVRGTIGHSWPTDLDRLQGRFRKTGPDLLDHHQFSRLGGAHVPPPIHGGSRAERRAAERAALKSQQRAARGRR
jgi:hypothetical protein